MDQATQMHTEQDQQQELARLRRRLDRFRAENTMLEAMIEDKSRSLFQAGEQLRANHRTLESLLTSLAAAVISTDADGVITSVGGRTTELAGCSEEELVGRPVSDLLTSDDGVCTPSSAAHKATASEATLVGADRTTPMLVACSPLDEPGGSSGVVITAIDITDRKRLEAELRHAQRLESIGSLAAGVAHELNTPIQYVLDSVRFMADVIDDLLAVDESHRAMRELVIGLDGGPALIAAMEAQEAELDLEFGRQEVPAAIDRAVSGLQRVASIVKALKRFSHPGEDVALADINQVVETSVTVARHEYKYVAQVELRLGEAPPVVCNKVRLSQVLVNLLVNAAHAIEDRHKDGTGRIVITTELDGDGARIDVADDGGGIPAEIREQVFDPFFTTKGPGRGTGQGLAMAYDVVVKGLGGRLSFDVDDGVGTTFHIWLPGKEG